MGGATATGGRPQKRKNWPPDGRGFSPPVGEARAVLFATSAPWPGGFSVGDVPTVVALVLQSLAAAVARAAVANASPWGLLALLGAVPTGRRGASAADSRAGHAGPNVAAGVGNLGPAVGGGTRVAWLANQAGPRLGPSWRCWTAAGPWLAPLWGTAVGRGAVPNLAETRGPRWPYLAAAAAMGVVAAAGWAVR
jgi:hypothetical protein